MANKQQARKRRVAADRQAEQRRSAAAKAERRRRLIIGGLVGFVALALIAPLTAGLIGSDDPVDDDPAVTTTSTLPLPPWVPDELAGATLTGPTPCPATDGTAERTTGFAEPPPMCIDDDATFDLRFATAAGELVMPVDAGVDPVAANLAAVFGWYRTYEGVTVETFDTSLVFVGGGDDTGFTIPVDAAPPDPADDPYPVGSVVALSTVTGLDGSLAVVLDEVGAGLLAATGSHALVGTVDDVEAIAEVAAAPLFEGVVRVEGVRVEETG